MSSVTEIETEIQKLSVAEQRIIARHLDERLVDVNPTGDFPAVDEGIRSLPQNEFYLVPAIHGGKGEGRAPGRHAH